MKLILSFTLMLVVSLAMQTSASGQVGFKVFVSDDGMTRELDLRATEGQNGQVNEVSSFAIKPESVVQINQNENLTVFTSTNEPDRIEKVKVTDQTGELIELTKIGGNEWSLQGFDDGVYLLDVIVNMPEGGKGAYETVLVILAPNTLDLNPTQVIAQVVNIQVDVRERVFEDDEEDRPAPEPSICYFDPNNEACNPDEEGKCPSGFGFNEDGRCIPQGKCPDGYGRLDDDETGTCYPKRDIKTCPSGYITHKFATCPEDQPGPSPAPNETEANDPCNYYGIDVCTGSGDDRQCDSERFDCLSVCEDGTTRTTGQCPGDDEDRTTSSQDDNETESQTEPTPTEPTPTEPTPTEPTPTEPTPTEPTPAPTEREDSTLEADPGSDQEPLLSSP
jgi:cell division septation protein DedD